jgi:methylmalonyl-CoA mutase
MSENNQKQLLFTEFPPVSTEAWEAVITKDLKGADYDKKLIWKTLEGIAVKPYYRAEDIQGLPHISALPGEFPFVRTTKKTSNEWFIRQDICVKDVAEANKKALEILMKGVTSIGFKIEDGAAFSAENLSALLHNICIGAIEVNFILEKGNQPFFEVLNAYFAKNYTDYVNVYGSLNFDPLGMVVKKGKFCQTAEVAYERAKTFIQKSAALTNFKVIGVHGEYFHNAGSTLVQELAFALAEGAEYLTNLTEAGLTADEIAPKIRFNFAVGSNYFMEMAKFRAARLLWAKVVEAYGLKDKSKAAMDIHAITARWNKTIYDSYVNMLRTTTEAMSAAIAGVDSMTVEPFDVTFEQPTDFSERIARNQQIILKEEAGFEKIVDPAAGSYYIETLTASIAAEAWKLFLAVQEKGGFTEALKAGLIQGEIKAIAAKRHQNIATRREILLGTNQYPNFTESAPEITKKCCCCCGDDKAEGLIAEPLKQFRGAEAFEEIRLKTDKATKRPTVFLLTYGNLSMRLARAQFAANFFACAGFKTINTNGFPSIDDAVKAAKDSGAEIVTLCSSDDEYATIAPEIFEKLNGSAIFAVAGAPACTDELKAKGITNFINVKSNVLETLKFYQQQLGL